MFLKFKDLMDVTKDVFTKELRKLDRKAIAWERYWRRFSEKAKAMVVRGLVGHGVGPTMHEEPMVPHYDVAVWSSFA